MRALPWRDVFTRQGVEPAGNDAFYHLRAIAWCVRNFPSTLGLDPYMDFPHGARPIAAPLFDWAVAALAWPFAGDLDAGDLAAVERLAVWVPPVLGAATVACVWGIVRRHFGAGPAGVAGLVLAVLSGHFAYSRLGNVDHHVAVALLSTLLLGAGLGLAAAPGGSGRRCAWGAGVVAGLLFLVWPGGLLHLALLDAGLLWLLLRQRARREARRRAADLCWLHAVACALVTPWAWGNQWPHWGRFAPAALSDFQPWLLGSAALALALAWGLWATPALGASRGRRAAGLALAVLAVGAAGAAVFPGLTASLGQAAQWLLRSEGFALYRGIREAQPLLVSPEGLTLRRALAHLSGFALLFPFALAVLAWSGRRRAEVVLLAVWAAGLFVAALLQQRFVNSFSVALAIVSGLAVGAAWRALPPAWKRPPRRRAAGVLLAAAGLALLAPTLAAYRRHAENQVRHLRGQGAQVIAFATPELTRWLRDSTPAPGGWLEPGARPAYGVLAPWHVGHRIKYAARRPVVADNFGEDAGGEGLHFAERVYAGDPEAALGELEARGIRYVVGYDKAEFLSQAPGPRSLLNALYLEATPGQLPEAPAFSGLRLLFESPPRNRRAPRDPPVYRVFERVPGARVVGAAPPGAVVEASLGLRSNRGRRLRYRARARADADGRWELRLPYSTRGAPPSTEPDPHYALSCGGRQAQLAIEEEQLRRGERIEAPDFCAGPPGEVPRRPPAA